MGGARKATTYVTMGERRHPTHRVCTTHLGLHDLSQLLVLTNCNLTTYLTGSALIPLGLTWWQAFISIIIGNILGAVDTVFDSLPGVHYMIGYPVFNRVVWAMWGSQFTLWNRIFLSFVWYGFTAWIGGQCVHVVLLSLDPKLEQHLSNTLPTAAGMTTSEFVSYIIFCVISPPFIWIRPHKLEVFFYVTSASTLVFFFILLGWALGTMGPDGFGSTLDGASQLPSTGPPSSVAWLMIYGIMSTIGSVATGILNQNDYARYATRPRNAIIGQVISFPVCGIIPSLIGILVTAATQRRFGGQAFWNLPDLFVHLLEQNDSAGTRAASFFAGLFLIASQIGINVPGNALSGGFDLVATLPQYINIRRGAYITALFSIAINPWRLLSSAGVFLTVLSSYGVFLGPMTGIMISSYLVVNKRRIHVDDLYHGESTSIYWYTYGCNWRAFMAWIIGTVPCLPGFIAAVNTSFTTTAGAIELYYINYAYGLLSAGFVYAVLHKIFPAQTVAQYIQEAPSARELQQTNREKVDLVMDEVAEKPLQYEHHLQGNTANNLVKKRAEEDPIVCPPPAPL